MQCLVFSSLTFFFSRTTYIRMMMMMMIVALRVHVSHLKHKWQHSSTLSCCCNTIQRDVSFKSHPIHPSLPVRPSSFLYPFFVLLQPNGCHCSWMMSIIVVHIRRRRRNMYIVYGARTQKKKKRTNNGRLLRLLFLLLSLSIYRCCDTHIRILSNACTSHTFCLLFLAYTCLLSLLDGIYRRRVMTRKERGEYVYGCMLYQTLNGESIQKSNPINCTKKRRKE